MDSSFLTQVNKKVFEVLKSISKKCDVPDHNYGNQQISDFDEWRYTFQQPDEPYSPGKAVVTLDQKYLGSMWALSSQILEERAEAYKLKLTWFYETGTLRVDINFHDDLGSVTRREVNEWIASLHSWCMIAPILQVDRQQKKRQRQFGARDSPPQETIHYKTHDRQHVWFISKPVRSFIVLSVDMEDCQDLALNISMAQSFCSEFRETEITYTTTAPRIILDIPEVQEVKANVGFLTFPVDAKMLDPLGLKELMEILHYRQFLTFHLATSKTFMHTNMRNEVEKLFIRSENARFKRSGADNARGIGGMMGQSEFECQPGSNTIKRHTKFGTMSVSRHSGDRGGGMGMGGGERAMETPRDTPRGVMETPRDRLRRTSRGEAEGLY